MEASETVFLGLTLGRVTELGLSVLGATVILILGWTVSSWVAGLIRRTIARHARFDRTLGLLFAQLARWSILAFTIVAVLGRFGVQTTSIVALLGAAGLAVGLALQGTLSNIASGVMLLALRPFRVGDAVEVGGTSGVVDEIGLFTTRMHTFDNVAVFMPNSSVWGNEIKNMSQNDSRRLELVVSIGYSDDIGKAMSVLRQILEGDERVLAEPAFRIGVSELADNSVNLLVWPWVRREHYLDLKLDITREVKERFDAEGISFPFPQRELHLVQGTLPEPQGRAAD